MEMSRPVRRRRRESRVHRSYRFNQIKYPFVARRRRQYSTSRRCGIDDLMSSTNTRLHWEYRIVSIERRLTSSRDAIMRISSLRFIISIVISLYFWILNGDLLLSFLQQHRYTADARGTNVSLFNYQSYTKKKHKYTHTSTRTTVTETPAKIN